MNGWWNLESVFEGLDLTPPKNCPGRLLSVLDAGAVDLSGKALKGKSASASERMRRSEFASQ